MKEFVRGQKGRLSDLTPAEAFRVGVDIQGTASQVFDISCFGVDQDDRLSDDRYFIFYNQKTSPEGALKATGPGEGDRESFEVDLSRLPSTIRRLVFTITVDGPGVMKDVSSGHLRIVDSLGEVVRFRFRGEDFGEEKAVVAGEIYFKEAWRFGAVGQGFKGGLSALLKHFGGEEIAAPPSSPAPSRGSAPPVPSSSSVDLEKRIEKEAPQLVSLVKQATVSLKKVGLEDHRAKVALCLDISGSMSPLYASGTIQSFAERILALGCKFDDDGSTDIFLFGKNAHEAGEMSIGNFKGRVDRLIRKYGLEGSTFYGKVMSLIRKFYFPDGKGKERAEPVSSDLPVYVMFLTDGETFDGEVAEQQMRWASFEPVFWQFMAVGKGRFGFLEKLDTMGGRFVDNANFFNVDRPDAVSDDQLYDLLMAEYPDWLKLVRSKGLLGGKPQGKKKGGWFSWGGKS